MGNRKLPFGYQMRMGEIIRNEPESKAVQDIFLQYTLGASLKEIAEQMSKTGPSYDEGKSWNKNMVARILENAKYIGADSYPKLVDIKLFEAAAGKRQTKQRLPERTPAQKALKRVCSKPPTPEIEQQVVRLLGRLAEQPERITQPEKTPASAHTNTQAELDDVLNTQPLDEDAARSLICKLAQEQYDAIGNEEYETERLRRLFTAFECTAELNAALLQSAVSAVLVTRQAVRLQLKTDRSLERTIWYDRRKAARHYHSTQARIAADRCGHKAASRGGVLPRFHQGRRTGQQLRSPVRILHRQNYVQQRMDNGRYFCG